MRTPTPVLFRPKDSQTDNIAMVSQRVVLAAGSCAGWISVGLKGLSSLLPLNSLHIPLARQAGRGRHLLLKGLGGGYARLQSSPKGVVFIRFPFQFGSVFTSLMSKFV